MNRRTVLWGIAAMLLSWGVIAPASAEETVTLFVTSMKTGAVNVHRGQVPHLIFVKGIPVGREPHNLGISPDGPGTEPFHLTATAQGILFVANHRSGTVTIIDGARRVVLGVLKVPPGPHGVAVLVHPPDAERTAKEVPGK